MDTFAGTSVDTFVGRFVGAIVGSPLEGLTAGESTLLGALVSGFVGALVGSNFAFAYSACHPAVAFRPLFLETVSAIV